MDWLVIKVIYLVVFFFFHGLYPTFSMRLDWAQFIGAKLRIFHVNFDVYIAKNRVKTLKKC